MQQCRVIDANEVLARLRELGTAQNRKVYSRHGDGETFGVSFANLYALRKAIKRDQPLADDLWATGVSPEVPTHTNPRLAVTSYTPYGTARPSANCG